MLGLILSPRNRAVLQPFIERDVTSDCLFLVRESEKDKARDILQEAFLEWLDMGESPYGDYPEVTCAEYLGESLKNAGVEYEVYYDRKEKE